MPIMGDIKNLYSDKNQSRALFPTTKIKAVSDDDGKGLNAVLDDMTAYTRKVGNPHNLLDNSDFRNPINQRGKTEYVQDRGYCIDRWYMYWSGSDGKVAITSDGITLSRPTHSTYMFQMFENIESMVGKTYTVAAKMRGSGCVGWSDSVYGRQFVMYTGDDWKIVTHTFTVASSTFSIGSAAVELRSNGDKAVTFEWVALYEGEYTAETLPEYQPKGYGVELAECQRYYYQTWYDNTKTSENGVAMTIAGSTTSSMPIQLPNEMRVVPTITLYSFVDGATGIVPWGGSTLSGVTLSNVCNKNFRIRHTAGGLTAGKVYAFHFSASADL